MPILKELIETGSPRERKIVVIRHGETNLNKDDKIRGWSDIPLNEHGFDQATQLGRKLKGSNIDLLISSDLTRTLQTALCISRESGIPLLQTSIALRPWNVGKYTGYPQEEIRQMLVKMAVEEPEKTIPDGESFDSFRCRCLMGVLAFLNQYPDRVIAFVAHHRNDRLLRGWLEAGCPDDLEVDMTHFSQKGILPGTHDVMEITSNLLV